MAFTSNIAAYLEHLTRFRRNYSAEQVNGALAQIYMAAPDDGETLTALGRFCVRMDMNEEARRFFAGAIERGAPDWAAAAGLGLAELLEREAGALRRRATARRRRAVAERPDDPGALADLADALAAVGRTDAAEAFLRRAERLDPGNETAALGLGRLLRDLRRFDEAVAALETGLRAHPRSSPLLEALVGVGESRGDPAATEEACLRALRVNPYNPPAARRLSAATAAQGWFDAAMRNLTRPDVEHVEAATRRRFSALPPGGAGNRRVHFVSFAYGATYERKLAEMAQVATRRGATHVHPWSRDDLTGCDFYRANREVLDLRRGAGYWLWKPFIILQTLLAADDGDWVWYHDAGHELDADVTPIVDWADGWNDGYMPGIYLPCYKSREWTKRDCYVTMNCDAPRYWDHCLIQPGWSFWRKSPRSVEIVAEWLKCAVDPRALTDHPNVCGSPDPPEFVDHRHDQSVFTCLFVKMGLSTFGSPADPLPRHPKDVRFLAERARAFLEAQGRR